MIKSLSWRIALLEDCFWKSCLLLSERPSHVMTIMWPLWCSLSYRHHHMNHVAPLKAAGRSWCGATVSGHEYCFEPPNNQDGRR
jgi:hypothetical protein